MKFDDQIDFGVFVFNGHFQITLAAALSHRQKAGFLLDDKKFPEAVAEARQAVELVGIFQTQTIATLRSQRPDREPPASAYEKAPTLPGPWNSLFWRTERRPSKSGSQGNSFDVLRERRLRLRSTGAKTTGADRRIRLGSQQDAHCSEIRISAAKLGGDWRNSNARAPLLFYSLPRLIRAGQLAAGRDSYPTGVSQTVKAPLSWPLTYR